MPLHKVYVLWILLRPGTPFVPIAGNLLVSNAEPDPQSKLGEWALVLLAWLAVTIPLLWGIWQTVKKATVLFR